METLLLLLTLASIHIGVVMAPGPNFLIIIKNSLSYSRHTGMVTARGVALGTIIYVIAGFLGFTALLSQSVVLFNFVKWLGVIYFVFMGIKAIRSARKQAHIEVDNIQEQMMSDRQAIRSGFFTMLSNVKAAFYFMLLFTTVMPPQVSLETKIIITAMIPGISLIWYSILATTFSTQTVRKIYRRFERWLNSAFGAMWVALGMKLATVTR